MSNQADKVKKGIESIKVSVIKDTVKSGCFNENGCDKTGSDNKCFHNYCNTYAWIIERAKHYAEACGLDYLSVLETWEEDRSYWYMNYYQDCNQPKINPSESQVLYSEWESQGEALYGTDKHQWVFKCPSCGNEQKPAEFIEIDRQPNTALSNCIGRYKKDTGCDWSLGGLLSIHKLSVVKGARVFPVFEFSGGKGDQVASEVIS